MYQCQWRILTGGGGVWGLIRQWGGGGGGSKTAASQHSYCNILRFKDVLCAVPYCRIPPLRLNTSAINVALKSRCLDMCKKVEDRRHKMHT